MVVDMYIIGPKKDWFKPVFFNLFDFSKMKKPRSRLQKTNKQSFSVLVLFGLSPVQLQSFASPRTGLSNTRCHCSQIQIQERSRGSGFRQEHGALFSPKWLCKSIQRCELQGGWESLAASFWLPHWTTLSWLILTYKLPFCFFFNFTNLFGW